MKIFVLGGYGKTGLPAIELLAQSELITEIAIVGRNLESAEKAAAQIGEKAIAVITDGTDEQQLIPFLAGYDMIVNAADNETVLPAIRAAIHSGAHYCDMAWGGILEQALQLATEAKDAGITAIVATGISPCISNLIGVHAARQLEEVEQLQIGRADIFNFTSGKELTPRQWLEAPKESTTALLDFKPFIAWMLQKLEKEGLRTALNYQDGEWTAADPIRSGIEVPLLQGGTIRAYPYSSGEDFFGQLPKDLARTAPVELSFSPFPPGLHEMLREQVLSLLEGQIDAENAVNNFYDTVEADPHRWLTAPDDFVPVPKMWVRAVGRKAGRAARHSCWFTPPMWKVGGYFLTSVALTAAVQKVLRGEIQERSVITAEKAFEPQSFFDEVVALLPEPLPDGKLINETFERLE